MLNFIKVHYHKFARDEDGFVLAAFLPLIIPAFVLLGLVIDYGRAQMAEDRLFVAAQETALTAAYYGQTAPDKSLERAQKIFHANFDNGSVYFRPASFEIVTPGTNGENRVFVTARVIVDTSILGLLNFSNLTVGVQAAASCTGSALAPTCTVSGDRLSTDY